MIGFRKRPSQAGDSNALVFEYIQVFKWPACGGLLIALYPYKIGRHLGMANANVLIIAAYVVAKFFLVYINLKSLR